MQDLLPPQLIPTPKGYVSQSAYLSTQTCFPHLISSYLPKDPPAVAKQQQLLLDIQHTHQTNMSSVASAPSYASMTMSRDRESPSGRGRGGPIATSSFTDAGSDPSPLPSSSSFFSSSSQLLPKPPNEEDEWTTVSYKKPESKNRSRHRYKGRRGCRRGRPGRPTLYKHEQIGRATTTTAAAPGSGSGSSSRTTVAAAATDEAKDEADAEIQGSLPGWYNPPLWDRRPGFARGRGGGGGREG
ncbi:hypothetical protein F5X96DRAFT_66376 [Biscogniauxia mediterranea]|nr:hypothetical protein F5X96DRAFT_66376 [Biscogniauxia mediterranea]